MGYVGQKSDKMAPIRSFLRKSASNHPSHRFPPPRALPSSKSAALDLAAQQSLLQRRHRRLCPPGAAIVVKRLQGQCNILDRDMGKVVYSIQTNYA
jgi:hypothetical protein